MERDSKVVARHVLIVEDQVLIAMDLEDALTALGHGVFGNVTRLDKAMHLAREADIDFAILDIDLAGEPSFPVAAILRERAIPFIFTSGYGDSGLVDGYRDDPTLSKPFAPHELERAIATAFEREPRRAARG